MSDQPIVVVKSSETQVEASSEDVETGQWYWVKDSDDGTEWLGCVTHVGSNYVKMSNVFDGSQRVHFDVFQATCRREPNAPQVIERNVHSLQGEVRKLMAEVAALTARLGVGPAPALPSGASAEGHALARLDPDLDANQYKTALIKAKEEDLPALFSEIKETHEKLAHWLRAEMLPVRAQVAKMKGAISRIDDRLFTVELYAGLTETVEQIQDGQPAAMTEKIRLMQRRCYMDEECLAHYEVGGMEFGDMEDFDAWLLRPEHLNRILPFPRCIVAFQVRRNMKERSVRSFNDFIRVLNKMRADKLTFLYIRNGERVYRMSTEIEFGEHMFPDVDHNTFTSGAKLWAHIFVDRVDSIITDAQYQGLMEEHEAKKAKHQVERTAHAQKVKQWRAAKKAAKATGQPFTEREPHLFPFWDRPPSDQYQPFEPNNIYYDDVQKKIAAEIQQYNRIAIIIQGLLDRSPVLHPHPPWKLWAEGGSEQALEFIFDATRALVSGERPDFEAYRQQLNASLKTGSITVGQWIAWRLNEEDDEESDDYGRRKSRKTFHGDPGPGVIARIERYEPRAKKCNYAWYREGETYETRDKKIRVRFTCAASRVLNVDAYKPGDFKRFFSDPRTRADYLEWAPLLLGAEEYHAGNRPVEDPPPPAQRHSSFSGRRAYQRAKERKRLLGKKVRLAYAISTQGGTEYPAGSLWEVTSMERGGLTISQLSENGEKVKGWIRKVEPSDLILAE